MLAMRAPPLNPRVELKHGQCMKDVLDLLEAFHGVQTPAWPVRPFEFLIWWHCGYPQSDAACAKGWDALHDAGIEVDPTALARTSVKKLAAALQRGGLISDLRAGRIQTIARAEMPHPLTRGFLKTLPGIGDPGADRILLFADLDPVAAVPSNATQVLPRIFAGEESKNYQTNYRDGQRTIASALPEDFAARTRAYLLIKRHGQTRCKRTNPQCGGCPLCDQCRFAAAIGISKAEAGDCQKA